jgi:hypothetical protein
MEDSPVMSIIPFPMPNPALRHHSEVMVREIPNDLICDAGLSKERARLGLMLAICMTNQQLRQAVQHVAERTGRLDQPGSSAV